MKTDFLMRLFRRWASLLLAICFVLPLSRCDAGMDAGHDSPMLAQPTSGYDVMRQGLRDLEAGEFSEGLARTMVAVLVFFLPVAMWKVPDAGQALVHVAATPVAGCIVYGWVFAFARQPLVGGFLVTACWAMLLLSGCRTLWEYAAQWGRQSG